MNSIFGKTSSLLIFFCSGFAVQAESLKKLEIKKDQVKMAPPKDQQLHNETHGIDPPPKEVLRNGFIEMDFGVRYFFEEEDYSVNSTLYYGEVLKVWSQYLSTGRIEQKFGMGANFISKNNWRWSFQSVSEFNFLSNNGQNTFIPGISLPVSVFYSKNRKALFPLKDLSSPPPLLEKWFSLNVGLSMFLKVFISKRWALIPMMTVDLAHYSAVWNKVKKKDNPIHFKKETGGFIVTRNDDASDSDFPDSYSSNHLHLVFQLSLRRYF